MIGRQLIGAVTRRAPPVLFPELPLRPAQAHPLRACPCDVDLRVFGHTQCAEAGVQWPDDPQARPD